MTVPSLSARVCPALCLAAALFFLFGIAQAQAQDAAGARVHLNQVGFYPQAPKIAVVTGAPPGGPFYVTTPTGADTALAGTLGPLRDAPLAGQTVRGADFSSLEAPGEYVLEVPGAGRSYPFAVAPRVHRGVAEAALKGFYFQRASTALPEPYAGRWQRAAGHPDTDVRVHPSAASEARPAGTRLSAPKGWYDAGDYNKYVVNSGFSTATLLSLYEDFSAFADTLHVGIPESGNALPDVLDEALWNLRWVLRMQDLVDGGVYHKLTAANFEGEHVAPAEATAPRYVVQKSTAATLDFAAVMAQAGRVFRRFEAQRPALADTFVTAARSAWQWAQQHPGVVYDQQRLNERFDPDIQTGEYGDEHLRDEFIWAAAELYATTGEPSFLKAVDLFPDDAAPVPSWPTVRTLGYYTLARLHSDDPAGEGDPFSRAKQRIVQKADSLVAGADTSAYRVAMGQAAGDFVWGSNAVAANQGILLLWAYRLTGEQAYLRSALSNLDYLLGRNPTSYSFVTGVGDKTPRHPHHRPSASDDVAAPVPGLLAGGPNPGQQDAENCRTADVAYPSDLPALSYVDAACSYASNEIAINWNAPLVYLAGALEALQEADYERR